MNLTDDKELDALHADWLKKTTVAAAADQALQGAFDGVAQLRQDSQVAAQAAREAAQVLHDRVFLGPAVDNQQVADWERVGGSSMRDKLDPAKLADSVFSSIVTAATSKDSGSSEVAAAVDAVQLSLNAVQGVAHVKAKV